MLHAEPWFQFDVWYYAPNSGTLKHCQDPHQTLVLEPRLQRLLNYFIHHPQQILSKDQLLNEVWGAEFGTDAALMRAVAALRKVLNDQVKPALYLETHPRKGYLWKIVLQPLVSESILPVQLAEANSPVIADELLVTSMTRHSLQVLNRRRYLAWSAVIVTLCSLVFCCLLWYFERVVVPEQQASHYPFQLNISAMPGAETDPMMTPTEDAWLYWYQPSGQSAWQLIRHERATHRQRILAHGFTAVGQLHWAGQDLLFSAVTGKQHCGVFRLKDAALSNASVTHIAQEASDLVADRQAMPIQLNDCEYFLPNSLAVMNERIYWLEQRDAEIGLWTLHQNKAQQLLLIKGHYRLPIQLLAGSNQLYLLLQEHHLSYQLLQWSVGQTEATWLADFAIPISHLSWWDPQTLLISGAEQLQRYRLGAQHFVALLTPAGTLFDVKHQGETLLGAMRSQGAFDLIPLELNGQQLRVHRQKMAELISNQDDWLFREEGVFVSNRSGLPQIWRSRAGQLRQLTKFDLYKTVSQLIWHQQQLFAVVDQQLMRVALDSGALSPVSWAKPAFKRLVSCQQQWFWLERASHWALYQLQQGRGQKIADNIVDIRCGPANTLILQQDTDPHLLQFSLETGAVTELPIRLDWRRVATELWDVRGTDLYWFAAQQLHHYDFIQQQHKVLAHPMATNDSHQPEALYAPADSPLLFMLQRRSQESDIIQLAPVKPLD